MNKDELNNLSRSIEAINNDPDLKDFRESLKILLSVLPLNSYSFLKNGSLIIDRSVDNYSQIKALVDLIDHREQMIRETHGVNISSEGKISGDKK